MGRVAVYAGRVVRCHDRRLDNAERSSVGLTHDILAPGSGLGLNGCRAMRGIGVRHEFYRRTLLFGHHHGGTGKKRLKIRLILKLTLSLNRNQCVIH